MFLRKWEPIEGRIVASETHRVSTGERGHRTVQNKYVVEYSIDGGDAQRVELKQATYWRGSMKMINPLNRSTVPRLSASQVRQGALRCQRPADKREGRL